MKQWLVEISRWEEYDGEGEYKIDFQLVAADSFEGAVERLKKIYNSSYQFYNKTWE